MACFSIFSVVLCPRYVFHRNRLPRGDVANESEVRSGLLFDLLAPIPVFDDLDKRVLFVHTKPERGPCGVTVGFSGELKPEPRTLRLRNFGIV